MISTIEVQHCVHLSDRPFDEVVAAFMEATGSVEEGFGVVAAGATTQPEFEAAFRLREGSSGFTRFSVIDHGRWLAVMGRQAQARSEEHTSELQSLMRISYAVFCLKKKTIMSIQYDTANFIMYTLT